MELCLFSWLVHIWVATKRMRVSFCAVDCDFHVVLALVLLYAGWT
jgi:hypothetical protein